MKTKHLLTALALPALFAACTADDIVTESVNQTERIALNENFKMNELDDGSLEINSRKNGTTVFTATVYDAEGNEIKIEE